ncbi:hypothetical protein Asp14428_09740 [Actinoplanes sp. NBRC 14428]|nr:hypothetical protein Asp14428_09740 [Actinoplanes sp. NBRC 14428]
MSFWLDLSAPPGAEGSHPPAGDLALAPAGPTADGYRRMVAVGSDVAGRVSHCLAGPAWLRRRFPARSHVQIHASPAAGPAAAVEYLRTEPGPDGDDGPYGIHCGLAIPGAWTVTPGDGLLGLRLLQAVLHALQVVGAHYGIGMPSAVRPQADPGLGDPFGPPPRPSYAAANPDPPHLAGSPDPGHLLLAVKEPAPATHPVPPLPLVTLRAETAGLTAARPKKLQTAVTTAEHCLDLWRPFIAAATSRPLQITVTAADTLRYAVDSAGFRLQVPQSLLDAPPSRLATRILEIAIPALVMHAEDHPHPQPPGLRPDPDAPQPATDDPEPGPHLEDLLDGPDAASSRARALDDYLSAHLENPGIAAHSTDTTLSRTLELLHHDQPET